MLIEVRSINFKGQTKDDRYHHLAEKSNQATIWMEDYQYHSGSKQENRHVHARSFREELNNFGELIAVVLQELRSQIRYRDILRININRKPLQSLELRRPMEEMLLPDSRSWCCPERTAFISEFTWLELGHGGRSCPGGVGTTEKILPNAKRGKGGGGIVFLLPTFQSPISPHRLNLT